MSSTEGNVLTSYVPFVSLSKGLKALGIEHGSLKEWIFQISSSSIGIG
jgi:hypothetical protein